MKLIKTESGIIAVSENNFTTATINGIEGTLKLKFSPEVAAVLGVWDENEEYVNFVIKNGYYYTSHGRRAFEHALSLKSKFEFTEEDMRNAITFGFVQCMEFGSRSVDEENSYIESVKNKQFEVESFEKSDDTLTVLKLK